MNNQHQPLTYSVKEACRISSLGRTRIFQLIKSGQLQRTKVGRRTLIDAESLKRLITPQ